MSYKRLPLAFLVLGTVGLIAAGCSEVQMAAHTAKSVRDGGGSGQIGSYKVGQPYQISGVWYHPTVDYEYNETGIASWYGPGFHGKATANGEQYDQNSLTAAHPTLPLPSMVRVTNLENGRSLKLRINDRGPFANNRIIDISKRGAQLLGFEKQGTAKVRITVLENESRQLAAAAQGKKAPEPVVQQAVYRPEDLQPTKQQVAAAPVSRVSTERLSSSSNQEEAPEPDGIVSQESVSSSDLYIQAGSFTEYTNATRLADRLSTHGDVRIAPVSVDGRDFYRVQIGPVASVGDADGLLENLISNGYKQSHVVVQ
ncbi:septal ring lytic transglycosylase RlpA family protein [Fodinicurvata sediminis]|uniref:septal ring lytic transglycosylase RlpA family protein n=1 Tax=Fodinicurvata sediminis TaxID=1121832 RepID=UPI0003FEE216|nr:septal ring lytic transglycosylase RlpA family protein [Fodinicurvata sediminis]